MKKSYTPALIVLTTLFFMWGFITCMNDILVPYLIKIFNLNYKQASFVQLSFFGAYFTGSIIYFVISSIFGDPINKIGYKNGIVAGLLTSATGTCLFVPAAASGSYTFYLIALFVLGIGLTLLQIASNPYVAILGSDETASSRLNLTQAFNSLGTTIAPMIGGYFVFHYFAVNGNVSPESVRKLYMIFTLAFVLLAVLVFFSKLPVFTNSDAPVKGIGSLKITKVKLGMLAIFMYVGAEVSIGTFLIRFLGLKDIAGIQENEASTFVAFYWGGLMIGRFMGAISLSGIKNSVVKYLIMAGSAVLSVGLIYAAATLKGSFDPSQTWPFLVIIVISFVAFIIGRSIASRTLFIFALLIIAMLILVITTKGNVAMWAIICIGLFNSIMWSNIFTISIAGLKEYTSQASSLLVMMIVGGALIPVLQGVLADSKGIQISFIIPLIAFIYIAFYGLHGYITNKSDHERLSSRH